MDIAIIANKKYRDYIIQCFGSHPELDFCINGFYVLDQTEECIYANVPVRHVSELLSYNSAIILFAIDSKQFCDALQAELLSLFGRPIQIGAFRPYTLDMKLDFVSKSLLDNRYIDKVIVSEKKRYSFKRERIVVPSDIENASSDEATEAISFFDQEVMSWKTTTSGIGMMVFKNYHYLDIKKIMGFTCAFRKHYPHTEIRIRTTSKALGHVSCDFYQFLHDNDVLVEFINYSGYCLSDDVNSKIEEYGISTLCHTLEERDSYLERESMYLFKRLNRVYEHLKRANIQKMEIYGLAQSRKVVLDQQKAILDQQKAMLAEQRANLDEYYFRERDRKHRLSYIVRLEDCFSAGYSIPQFCEDNRIVKPLFVGADSELLWQIHVQFVFWKRKIPVFANATQNKYILEYSEGFLYAPPLEVLPLGVVNVHDYDCIFVLDYSRDNYSFFGVKTLFLPDIVESIQNYIYNVRPFIYYEVKHPGVKVMLMNHPIIDCEGEKDEDETIIFSRNLEELYDRLVKGDVNEEYLPFSKMGYSREETIKLIERPEEYTLPNGTSRFKDVDDNIIGISEGVRKTIGQIDDGSKNRIYCVGICQMYGYCAPYDKTIESYLQISLNDAGIDYIVVNAGMFLSYRSQDLFYNLEQLPVRENDIVVAMLPSISECKEFPFLDVSGLFVEQHKFEGVYSDRRHINERGYRIVAKKLFDFLVSNHFLCANKQERFEPRHPIRYGIVPADNRENKYQNELDEYKKALSKKRALIGAIVANCNPFTKGHRYLIEYASKRCDRIYVFVVEEDASLFSFEERFKMVELGVDDLKNVTVLPSGKFIASALTFKEYFNKEQYQDQRIDPSIDLLYFAKEIAPELSINIRFVGEEPYDTITRQYNERMKDLLPRYGISVVEIPRKKMNRKIISASAVREEMENNDFEKIRRLVPDSSFSIIENKKGASLI